MYRAFSTSHDHRSLALYAPVEVYPKYPSMDSHVTLEAVWDTGATFTAISWPIAEQCGIVVVDETKVDGIGGKTNAKVGGLAIRLPNGLFIPDKRIVLCELPSSVKMVIGMDIIQLGDSHISNADGKTLFSFIFPSLPTPLNLEDEARKLNL